MQQRQYSVSINEQRCRPCAVCWEICPTKVLASEPPLNKSVVVNLSACTGCRLCEWMCPDWAIVVHAAGTTQAARPA